MRRASGPTSAMPAAASASSRASATATFVAWCRPRRPTRVGPRRGNADVDPVAVPAQDGRGGHLGERHPHAAGPAADDLEPVPVGPGHRQVAALDDRGLLPGDVPDRRSEPVHVVERDVGDDRDTAVPGVGGVQPAAQAHLDEGQIEVRLRECQEDDGREELEFGGLAEPPRDPVGGREHAFDEPGERGRVDRVAVEHDPLAVGHEVRLRGLADPQPARPQGAARERQHAALAVRARRRARRGSTSCGSPSSRSSARVRPSPRRMPKRPRSASAASASS